MAKPVEQLRKIGELEALAKALRTKVKNKVMPRKPILIEFSGSPRSGKTQSISSLSVFLRRNKFEVMTIVEYASINPIRNKFDPVFNVWNGCQSLCKILEVLNSKIQRFDFVLVDRGIFDALCWLRWQMDHGKLSSYEYSTISRFLSMQKWVALVNLVCLFTATPEKSLEREYSTLLTSKPGSVMRQEILAQYNEATNLTTSDYKSTFSAIEKIDTSEMDQNEVSYLVTKKILTTLDNIINERIGCFELDKFKFRDRGFLDFRQVAKSIPALNFNLRVKVEPDTNLIQPVAIALVIDKQEGSILIGRKLKKTLSNSSPEYEREVYWFGGHVREEDGGLRRSKSRSDLVTILHSALKRELKEELDIDYSPLEPPRYAIWSEHTNSGRKHLAFLFIIETEFSLLKIYADDIEFADEDIKILSKSEYRRKDRLDTDDWSKFILKYVLKWDDSPILSQAELVF